MRNSYPGTCFVCGDWVKVGDGHFTKKGGKGKWRVKHWFHAGKVKDLKEAKKLHEKSMIEKKIREGKSVDKPLA